jgi:hypothetical protein
MLAAHLADNFSLHGPIYHIGYGICQEALMLLWLMNLDFAGGGGAVTPTPDVSEYRIRFRIRRGR